MSCQNEQMPLYQTVILCLAAGAGERKLYAFSKHHAFAGKCFFPITEWTCTSALLYPPRHSMPWHGNEAIFPCSLISNFVKALHPFQEEGSFGKEFSRVTRSTFSALFCCAVWFETLLPWEQGTAELLSVAAFHQVSPALRTIGRHFNVRPVSTIRPTLSWTALRGLTLKSNVALQLEGQGEGNGLPHQ